MESTFTVCSIYQTKLNECLRLIDPVVEPNRANLAKHSWDIPIGHLSFTWLNVGYQPSLRIPRTNEIVEPRLLDALPSRRTFYQSLTAGSISQNLSSTVPISLVDVRGHCLYRTILCGDDPGTYKTLPSRTTKFVIRESKGK